MTSLEPDTPPDMMQFFDVFKKEREKKIQGTCIFGFIFRCPPLWGDVTMTRRYSYEDQDLRWVNIIPGWTLTRYVGN